MCIESFALEYQYLCSSLHVAAQFAGEHNEHNVRQNFLVQKITTVTTLLQPILNGQTLMSSNWY